MTPDILRLSVVELAEHVRTGRLSAVDVSRAFLDQIGHTEKSLRAWVTYDPERALLQAKSVDDARARGDKLGLLAGVPVGVKDIYNTKDLPTEMGSPIWKGFTPGNDARCVHYVRENHGVIVGKTVTAEFAVHELRETIHPYDPSRNPGTSSTGSAVAVAAFQVPLALGTQTAGSIIRPASYNGVWACKPSFGLIPRTGMLKTTDTLDSPGFFVRSPGDLKPTLDALRVSGSDYPVSHAALSDEARQNKPAGRPWRVALVRPHTWSHAHPYAKEALARELVRWQDASVEIVERELPRSTVEAHTVHAVIYDRTLAYYFKTEYANAQLVSPVFRKMVEHGLALTPLEYQAALERQRVIAAEVDAAFEDVDAFVTLSVAGEPVMRTEDEPPDSCLLWTLCMLPVVNVPALKGPNGLPMGVQVVARRYNDFRLFRLIDHLAELAPVPSNPWREGSEPHGANSNRTASVS